MQIVWLEWNRSPSSMARDIGLRCSFRAARIIAPDAITRRHMTLTAGIWADTDDIIAYLGKNPLVRGVTLSGGEPMMQPEPLRLIAQAAKERGMNVWCYTGFTLEKLLEERREDRMRLLECVDVLVDGPYLSHERSLDLLYRGSRNQRLIDMPATLKAGQIVLYTPPEW